MRKTMIFRSNRTAILFVALGLTAGAVRAQDTLQVGGAQPTVHVVIEGETLWDLAQRYLGDPFLWPEIYRLNTLVVEDPHWIFPGEELRLGPPDTTMVPGDPGAPQVVEVTPGQFPDTTVQIGPGAQPIDVVQVQPPDAPLPLTPGTPPPPPSTENLPTVFMREGRGASAAAILNTPAFRYRSIRRGDFYAAGFLTEGQSLPWGEVRGRAGRPTIRRLTATSSAMVLGRIEIRAPGDATYAVGDSLLLASRTRSISGWGNVVVPTGIAVVSSVDDRDVLAELVTQFNQVADGQVALPLEPFTDPGVAVPVPVQNGMLASVIARRDVTNLPEQLGILFIDVGRDDGVALGDVFVVLGHAAGEGFPPDTLAYMQIVHSRDRSSSALVTHLNDIGVGSGAPVVLYRKMPL